MYSTDRSTNCGDKLIVLLFKTSSYVSRLIIRSKTTPINTIVALSIPATQSPSLPRNNRISEEALFSLV
jgi:hypothetical protein